MESNQHFEGQIVPFLSRARLDCVLGAGSTVWLEPAELLEPQVMTFSAFDLKTDPQNPNANQIYGVHGCGSSSGKTLSGESSGREPQQEIQAVENGRCV